LMHAMNGTDTVILGSIALPLKARNAPGLSAVPMAARFEMAALVNTTAPRSRVNSVELVDLAMSQSLQEGSATPFSTTPLQVNSFSAIELPPLRAELVMGTHSPQSWVDAEHAQLVTSEEQERERQTDSLPQIDSVTPQHPPRLEMSEPKSVPLQLLQATERVRVGLKSAFPQSAAMLQIARARLGIVAMLLPLALLTLCVLCIAYYVLEHTCRKADSGDRRTGSARKLYSGQTGSRLPTCPDSEIVDTERFRVGQQIWFRGDQHLGEHGNRVFAGLPGTVMGLGQARDRLAVQFNSNPGLVFIQQREATDRCEELLDREEPLRLPIIGAPVVRGPDWCWGNQDGGPGSVGITVADEGNGWVEVRWPRGTDWYRIGAERSFDLALTCRAIAGERTSLLPVPDHSASTSGNLPMARPSHDMLAL